MDNRQLLAERFEENRSHLRAVAYRMLGSLNEADDAIQEAWLRLNRAEAVEIGNLSGWLTTVVARVCLDMLRSRASRREEALETQVVEPVGRPGGPPQYDPEQEALLADSVGLALLVVLDRLNPAERLAFVMHDMFAVPFEEIAEIVGRSPAAARQLASRARQRIQGAEPAGGAGFGAKKDVVQAFLTALRKGDFEGLLAVLDPDVLVRIDGASAAGGMAVEFRGAERWAKGAIAFSQGAQSIRLAMVDGEVGLLLAPEGHLSRAVRFTVADGRIVEAQVIGDADRLRDLELAVIED